MLTISYLLTTFQTWPFHMPVSSKKIPDYHKIIKSPMDLQTMKKVYKVYMIMTLILTIGQCCTEMCISSVPDAGQFHS